KWRQREVLQLAFAPDGRRFYSGGRDNKVVEWSAGTASMLRAFDCRAHSPSSLTVSPDGRRLVVGSGHILRSWDLVTGLELPSRMGHASLVSSVLHAKIDDRLISAGQDGTIKEWDVESEQRPAVLLGHRDIVRDVSISPDSRRAASAAMDGTVRVWNLEEGV